MKDYLYVGPVPSEENCAQVGEDGYGKKARRECNMFANQIERHYPPPAKGYLQTKANPHDFGTYYEVVAVFDTEDEESVEWAFDVESDPKRVLRTWDEESINEIIFGAA
jgi:hypothetical protein